ncbi:DUF3833 domain-containing protein [Thiomicrorhabdus aquaedulcis]|uniref:DUF3833 domain-containing protein n=1 Tax=Thiomicrorhabdus aquaedulcis TaxID=2211106 RepID=UPI001E356108|nr:DUF3833 domain-containing protein [Thiomicrorhabdus aquaedulcis]
MKSTYSTLLTNVMSLAILAILTFNLSGCASVKPQDYRDETPKLELFEFFAGTTQAWGQFQDRSGKVIRRFTVDITGQISPNDPNQLTLDERFVYNDGQTEQRIWHITRIAPNQYRGRAADVVGDATGESAGNALNWRYTLDLPYKDSTLHVQFDDWMFLHSQDTMFNRAKVTKWGFNVGEVTLFFKKPER